MNAIPLSRARVLGPRVSDLIAALQMLDPDARHSIEEVSMEHGVLGGIRPHLVGDEILLDRVLDEMLGSETLEEAIEAVGKLRA